MLLVDLQQSFFGRTIQLKFHHIDKFIRLQKKINASCTCVILCFDVKTNKFEDNKKNILIM